MVYAIDGIAKMRPLLGIFNDLGIILAGSGNGGGIGDTPAISALEPVIPISGQAEDDPMTVIPFVRAKASKALSSAPLSW